MFYFTPGIKPAIVPQVGLGGVDHERLGAAHTQDLAGEEVLIIPTLATEQRPEAGSLCPKLDLMEPIMSGSERPVQKISSMASNSSGSPTLVPSLKKKLSI